MPRVKRKISAFTPTAEAVIKNVRQYVGRGPRPSTSYRWARREGAKTNYRRQ